MAQTSPHNADGRDDSGKPRSGIRSVHARGSISLICERLTRTHATVCVPCCTTPRPSHTSGVKAWGDVYDNAKFEVNQGAYFDQKQGDIGAGDLLYVDWAGGTGLDYLNHMGVVVKVTSKNIYIAQHTPNGIDTLKGSGAHSWKHAHRYLPFYVVRPTEK